MTCYVIVDAVTCAAVVGVELLNGVGEGGMSCVHYMYMTTWIAAGHPESKSFPILSSH